MDALQFPNKKIYNKFNKSMYECDHEEVLFPLVPEAELAKKDYM